MVVVRGLRGRSELRFRANFGWWRHRGEIRRVVRSVTGGRRRAV